MSKKINISQLWLSLIILILLGCKEEIVNKPQIISGKPDALTEVAIKSLAGAAEISYLFQDNKVLYVLAEYEIRVGVKRQAKSSKYKDKLSIDGFSTAGEYSVVLYTVGEGEVKSDPLIVKVNILPSPLQTAFDDLRIQEDFGGINIHFLNKAKGDLSIDVFTMDANKKLVNAFSHYTSLAEVSFSVRGYNNEPRLFGVSMRDRWQNLSDTVFVEVTPLFEEQIDRRRIKLYDMPGDNNKGHSWGGGAPQSAALLFDGIQSVKLGGSGMFHSIPNSGIPNRFTFAIADGALAKLSRFKLWQRDQTDHIFASQTPKRFKVYGSLNPSPNGNLDDTWFLMGEYEMLKPSGKPTFENTADDLAEVNRGSEFSVPIDKGMVKYVRFETLETWGNTQSLAMMELEFWGAYQ